MKANKQLIILTLLIIFSISLVSAAGDYMVTCTERSDCPVDGRNYVCQDGYCIESCSVSNTHCSDGIDNDGDGKIDFFGACINPVTGTEIPCTDFNCDVQCNKKKGDGYQYIPKDPQCRSPLDNYERGECADGIDNDLDGFIDYPADEDCTRPEEVEEGGAAVFRAPTFEPEKCSTIFGRYLDWLFFFVDLC